MAAVAVAADALTEGSWIAHWGAWEISLRGAPGWWSVRVCSCVLGQGRTQLGKRNVFWTSAAAVGWACALLRQHGAVVFIDGREQRLEAFLAFEAVPADTR